MIHVRFINDQETIVTVPVHPDVDRRVLAVMPVKIKLELLRDTLGVNGGRDTDAASFSPSSAGFPVRRR